MLDTLFGVEMPLPVKFVLAFVVVLALIVAATWVFRRLGAARLGTASTRGRQPRLAVIDAATVDTRRRLVLIRRDNVEHLVLIGGPTDIVIEQNIVRAVPVAPPRDAQARPHAAETPSRGEPPGRPPVPTEPVWMPEPVAREPVTREPVMREPREPVVRAPRVGEPAWPPQPEPAARQGRPGEPAPKVQLPVDLPGRPLPEPGSAATRTATPEPARQPGPPALKPPAPRAAEEPQGPADTRSSAPGPDVNLADMAQRLEAALRRPARAGEPATRPEPAAGRPDAAAGRPEPAASRPDPAPSRPEPATGRPEPKARVTTEPPRLATEGPRLAPEPLRPPIPGPGPVRDAAPPAPAREAAPEATRPESPRAAEPAPGPTPEPAKPAEPAAETKPTPAKSVFDSLEEEMANLLGRPASKSSSGKG